MSVSSKANRLHSRLSINPDEVPVPATRPSSGPPVVTPVPALEEASAADPEPEPTAEAPAGAVEPALHVKPAGKERISALDDPTILAGRRDYRSFYVEDSAFARFRAAIYWLSRREDAAGVAPENMSVAIEGFMIATAEDLEKRYNHGQPFRMPPGQRRRRMSSRK